MVVGMSLYSQIREAYISGESQRSIAKRLGISRQTVKKYCEGETMPGVRKDYLRAPSVVTTEVESFISMCLEADKDEGLKKQTHTAKRIYDRLVSEMGFNGSYSIVRRVVHEREPNTFQRRRICHWNMTLAMRFRSTGARPPSICEASVRWSKSSVAGSVTAATSLSWPA